MFYFIRESSRFTFRVFKANSFRHGTKDFRASGLGQVRCLTAATTAITLAHLFVEILCYVLRRLYSSCVLSTRIGLHRIEVIDKNFGK